MKLRYSEKIESTELLGPRNRAALWVHGCCFDCPGCIAQNFRHGEYKEEEPADLARWFLETGTKELTISGGEPMLQAGALVEMISTIKEKCDVGIIVYTGFVYEELLAKSQDDSNIQRFLSVIDVLIDGPYQEELNHNEPYRGSSNQRLIQLTERYKDEIEAYYYSDLGRRIEIRINHDKTLMVGVPAKDQAEIWRRIKDIGK